MREIKMSQHETSGFKYKPTRYYTHILTFTVSLHLAFYEKARPKNHRWVIFDTSEKVIAVLVIELTVIDYTAPGEKSRWSYLKIS